MTVEPAEPDPNLVHSFICNSPALFSKRALASLELAAIGQPSDSTPRRQFTVARAIIIGNFLRFLGEQKLLPHDWELEVAQLPKVPGVRRSTAPETAIVSAWLASKLATENEVARSLNHLRALRRIAHGYERYVWDRHVPSEHKSNPKDPSAIELLEKHLFLALPDRVYKFAESTTANLKQSKAKATVEVLHALIDLVGYAVRNGRTAVEPREVFAADAPPLLFAWERAEKASGSAQDQTIENDLRNQRKFVRDLLNNRRRPRINYAVEARAAALLQNSQEDIVVLPAHSVTHSILREADVNLQSFGASLHKDNVGRASARQIISAVGKLYQYCFTRGWTDCHGEKARRLIRTGYLSGK